MSWTADELADLLAPYSNLAPQYQAAQALRRLGAIERILAHLVPGKHLRVQPPQSWHPDGDPLYRAWIEGEGAWGEGGTAMEALAMLAEKLEAEA